jgi:hypothetical protein
VVLLRCALRGVGAGVWHFQDALGRSGRGHGGGLRGNMIPEGLCRLCEKARLQIMANSLDLELGGSLEKQNVVVEKEVEALS